MTKLHLTGAWYSSRNAGDQAILVTIRELLESRIPDLQLEVICAEADFVQEEHGLPAVSQTQSLMNVLHQVWKNDGLLIGGGTPFYNDFKHMCYFWVLAVLTRLSGGKVVIYGASAQKLHQRSARWFAKRILEMAHLITVREAVTKDQLENVLHIKNQVICTADPAITLEACADSRVDEIMAAEGLDGLDRPIFAICPHFFSNTDGYRVHHYEVFDDTHIDRQRKVLAEAAQYLTRFGHVVFLPMNTDKPDSDLEVQAEIRALLDDETDISFVNTQYRPREIAGIYSRCKLTLGVRLHALIMSAAAGTPVIGINYAPKVKGFMELLGEPEHCIALQQLHFEEMKALLDDYLADYDARRVAFAANVDRLQGRARDNADMVASLFGDL